MILDAQPYLTGIPARPPGDLPGRLREFVARPESYRHRYLQSTYASVFDGYSYAGQADSMNQGPDDALHSFVLSDFHPASAYPREFQGFLQEHWGELTDFATDLERRILDELGQSHIGERLEACYGHMMSANYYPPVSVCANVEGPRLTEHPDVSLLTVFPFGIDAGFEYQNADGQWCRPGSIGEVCAFPGELLEWLTAGRVKALNHRVGPATQERFSFSLFSLPYPGMTVRRPLPERPVDAVPGFEELTVEAYIGLHLSRWVQT